MWKASYIMKDGFHKQVGNGENIEIEKDIWTGEKIRERRFGRE